MLKSYKEFLNENKMNYDVDIVDINECIFEDMEKEMNGHIQSFSSIAVNSRDENAKIEDYANKKVAELYEKFGKVTVSYLVESLVDSGDTCSYSNGVYYENGISDIIYNKCYSGFPLGGYDMIEDSDMFIRYSYGWQNEKYGKLAILQSYKSVEEFSIDAIKKYLEERLSTNSISKCYVQQSGLILIANSCGEDDVLGRKEDREYEINTILTGPDHKIIEVLTYEGNSVVTDDDWLKFLDKCFDEKKGTNLPWKELIADHTELEIDLDNYIDSKKGIAKYGL